MKKLLIVLIVIANVVLCQETNADNLSVPAIFSSNMVLQRNSDVPFWGNAQPNSTVMIKADWGQTIEAKSSEDGSWIVEVPTPEAGGPYNVNVKSNDQVIKYENVLIGEVWLCSGQSNMEMPLKGWLPQNPVDNSEEAIANSENSQLRFFTVERAYSSEPQYDCKGTWVESNPETSTDFSATAYFFGRKLSKELNIPIGLIHSSWGGTPVESWTSKKYLENVDKYKELLSNMKGYAKELKEYLKWLDNHKTIDVSQEDENSRWKDLDFEDSDLSAADYNTIDWNEMELPRLWEGADKMSSNFDGVVWYKKDIKIPADWVGKDLVIELGPIDDMDMTYMNGNKVGEITVNGFYNKDREYNIPAEYVNDENVNISIRVIDTQGGGGLFGKKEQLNIHPKGSEEKVSLAGKWKYLPVAEYRNQKFYLFGVDSQEYFSHPNITFEATAYTPTSLYNGMINPLIPFALRGVIWYQGEANVGDPKGYEKLFPLMIKNWREDWGEGEFPFYYVQIAPYDYGEGPYSQSQKLREAQLKSLSVPNTGIVVTLDIGNPNDIHPADKEDVGDRLAKWALAKTYDFKNIDFSGPLYKSLEVENGKAIISFDYAEKLIFKPEAGTAKFWIAGDDKEFKEAEVVIDGNKLLVSNPDVTNPVAVRYAWSNTATATLFDGEGLPASSFRTDDW